MHWLSELSRWSPGLFDGPSTTVPIRRLAPLCCWSSLLAGMAFGNADVGAVHCLGESLGGVFDTPHGLACAVFLPAVLEFNAVADPAKHARDCCCTRCRYLADD